jgi:dolichol-phosphate mannosyltransferase
VLLEKLLLSNKLLVFIPTYNEVGNIQGVIKDLIACLSDIKFDLLIVDDNSEDGTVPKILELGLNNLFLILNQGKMGIGAAHISALKFSQDHDYDFLITLDGDGTHGGLDIKRIVEEICKLEAEVLIGSRFLQPDSIEGWRLHRVFLTHVGHLVTKFGLGVPFDCSSGCRGYSVKRLQLSELLKLKAPNYDFFYKSIFLLSKNGYSVREIAVSLNRRASGSSKMSARLAISSIFRLTIDIVKFRIFG